MASDPTIRIRRIGARRTWPWRRLRAEYEVMVRDGEAELYLDRTIAPSSVLVTKGKVHTTDVYDWVRAADEAYARHEGAWISNPFSGRDVS